MHNGEDTSWAEEILRDVIEFRKYPQNNGGDKVGYLDLLPGIYDYEISSAIEDAADMFDSMVPPITEIIP